MKLKGNTAVTTTTGISAELHSEDGTQYVEFDAVE